MTDYKAFLTRLHNDLNALRERQAKQAGNAPLSLLNQIEDYERAISLTEQARQGEIDEAAWQEAIKPLLVSVAPGEAARQVVAILESYLSEQRAQLSQAAAEVAAQLRTAALDHLAQHPTGAVIGPEFEADPAAYRRPVEKLLAEALPSSPALAGRLKVLLERYGQAVRARSGPAVHIQNSVLTGGDRSVIGSSAGGSIVTGDSKNISD